MFGIIDIWLQSDITARCCLMVTAIYIILSKCICIKIILEDYGHL